MWTAAPARHAAAAQRALQRLHPPRPPNLRLRLSNVRARGVGAPLATWRQNATAPTPPIRLPPPPPRPEQCAQAEGKTAGGVLLTTESDKPTFGDVVAVGSGKKDEEGKVTAPNVAVGSTVMYSKYSGTEFEVRPRSGGGWGAGVSSAGVLFLGGGVGRRGRVMGARARVALGGGGAFCSAGE